MKRKCRFMFGAKKKLRLETEQKNDVGYFVSADIDVNVFSPLCLILSGRVGSVRFDNDDNNDVYVFFSF